jgi:predicted TIM-barrel fold metal-dependent hydrolase
VISGDSHVREPVDLWWRTIGNRFGDRTPRLVDEFKGKKGNYFFTGRYHSKVGVNQKPEHERTAEEDLIIKSGFDPQVRLEFQRLAGVQAEILYPSLMAQIIAVDDAAVAQACAEVYNDWIAEFCAADPRRLIGVGVAPVHDPDWARREIERFAKKGLRGALVNVVPPPGAKPLRHRSYDPLWQICEEADLPIVLHIVSGQAVDPLLYFHDREDYEEAGRAMLEVWHEIQSTLANEFIFGQILDRFPRLKLLCCEYEVSWIPHFLFRIDQIQADFPGYVEMPSLEHRASDYMRTRIWHGMTDDPYAADAIKHVGADRVLWGSDFPHVRSIGLDTQGRLAQLLDAFTREDQLRIVGGNTAQLFNLSRNG